MICPECLSENLKEIKFDVEAQDITYECEDCRFEFVVNVVSDNNLNPEFVLPN